MARHSAARNPLIAFALLTALLSAAGMAANAVPLLAESVDQGVTADEARAELVALAESAVLSADDVGEEWVEDHRVAFYLDSQAAGVADILFRQEPGRRLSSTVFTSATLNPRLSLASIVSLIRSAGPRRLVIAGPQVGDETAWIASAEPEPPNFGDVLGLVFLVGNHAATVFLVGEPGTLDQEHVYPLALRTAERLGLST